MFSRESQVALSCSPRTYLPVKERGVIRTTCKQEGVVVSKKGKPTPALNATAIMGGLLAFYSKMMVCLGALYYKYILT